MLINKESLRTEVLEALKEDEMRLEYVSDQLKRDIGVCRTAVGQDPNSLQFLDLITVTTMNRQIIEGAIKKTPLSIEHIPESIEGYIELVKIALEGARNAVNFISDEFKEDNKEFIAGILDKMPPTPRMKPVKALHRIPEEFSI
ncbi:MAG: hypothetical protein ACI9IL_000183 [Rickettsiales bacterium]|jgi:hypothetical protein